MLRKKRKNTAPNQAREKYLGQTKALGRISRSTWTKLKFISWDREVSMNRIIDELVDDQFKRQFPDLSSDSKKVPDKQGEILSHHVEAESKDGEE
jgi:hypothetical protein